VRAGERICRAVGLLFLVSTAAAPAPPPDLLPVPEVDTARMEPAVREQLVAERRALEAALAGPAGAGLAAAYGRCGRAYAAYQLFAAAGACFEDAARLAPGDFRWPYYLGTISQLEGDFEAAAARLGRALTLSPGDPAALLRLGEVELLRGRPAAARDAFARALPLPGAAAAAHFGLGRIALAAGDAAAAASHFEAALAAQPAAAAVRPPLATAYRKLGQLEKARAALAGYGAAGAGRVRFPDPLMEEVARGSAGTRQHVALGTAALREGRYAVAAEELKKALAADPGDAAAWANLGLALEKQGDRAAAEESYGKAIALDPGNARAQYNLGTLLAARGERKEGIEHLEAAVRLAPDGKDALFNLGAALAEAGEPARALAAFDRLLALAPADAVTRFRRASTLLALARYDEAAREFARLVAAEPAAPEPRAGEATALLLAGRDADAKSRLEEGLARLPESATLAQLLARVLAASPLAEVRDGRRALEIAADVLAVGPTPEREETLALALAELGRYAEAGDHQRRALALAGEAGRTDLGPLRGCLAHFEKSEPCRAPWKGGSLHVP
jgi:tetratricopeptide (TPR) repeat protein